MMDQIDLLINLYDLQSNKDYDDDYIKSRYYMLSKVYHPDVCDEKYRDGKMFQLCSSGKDFLIDNKDVVKSYLNIPNDIMRQQFIRMIKLTDYDFTQIQFFSSLSDDVILFSKTALAIISVNTPDLLFHLCCNIIAKLKSKGDMWVSCSFVSIVKMLRNEGTKINYQNICYENVVKSKQDKNGSSCNNDELRYLTYEWLLENIQVLFETNDFSENSLNKMMSNFGDFIASPIYDGKRTSPQYLMFKIKQMTAILGEQK